MPNDALTDIIANSVHEAEAGDTGSIGAADDNQSGANQSDSTEGSTEGAASAAADANSATTTGDAAAVPADAAKSAEGDDLDKLLDAEGVKPPVEGQRENRLPYTRVKKIVENARTKLTKEFTGQLAEKDTQLKTATDKARKLDAVDHTIANDPERYMLMLATLHPDKYGKYVKGGQVEQKQQTQPQQQVQTEPKPGPDIKYEDGSVGYSPEQHDKLLGWTANNAARQATAEAEKRFNERFGPIEQRFKTQQYIENKRPEVEAQISRAKETWGELFEADYKAAESGKSEILAYMSQNPAVPFDAAVAYVLTPKLRANRDTMRAELMREVKARPAAAVKTPAVSTKTSAPDPNEVRDNTDVIRDAIAAAGLR